MFKVNQLSGFGGGGAPGVQLLKSLNLNGSSQYIQRSPLVSGMNQTIGTWAYWARSTTPSTRRMVFGTGTSGGSPGHQQEWEVGNNTVSYGYASGHTVTATGILIPDTAWHHVVFAYNTNLGTQVQRLRVYIDGVENTTFGTANLGSGTNIQGANDTHTWGFKPSGPGVYWPGKFADLYYINGQQLGPTSFISGVGAGVCVPTRYIDTYDIRSYHLHFGNSDLVDEFNTLNFTAIGSPTFSTDVPVPYDVNTKLLLHCDGADASTTFTDSSVFGHTMTVAGNAQIDTGQSKFGGAAAQFDGSGDFLFVDGSADFAFGTGDFTVDFWVRPASAGTFFLYEGRGSSPAATEPVIYMLSGVLMFRNGNTDRITGTTTLTANAWHHVALTRSGTSTRLFLNGVQEGSTYTDSTNYTVPTNRPFFGMGQDSASGALNGHMDEMRVSKGVARWTANFTPPTDSYSS